MSLPRAMLSRDLEAENSGLSTTSRSQMVSRFSLGTWMPTVDFPATRSIRMLSARMARQRSSCRLTMRLYLMPASGLNSKVVTTGPGLICTTEPMTPNSPHFWVRVWASSFKLLLVVGHAGLGTVQQGAGRQLPRALLLGQGGASLGALRFVGPGADHDRLRGCGGRCGGRR